MKNILLFILLSVLTCITQADYLYKYKSNGNFPFSNETTSKDPEWNNVLLYLDTENGSIVDKSSYSRPLSILGPTVSNSTYKFGQDSINYSLKHTDEVRVSMPQLSGDFTIELWFNTPEYNLSSTYSMTIIDTRPYVTNGNNLVIGVRRLGALTVNLPDTSSSANIATSNYIFSKNTWHHLAITREGSTVRMFLNGALVGTTTNSTTIASTSWSIGKSAYETSDVPGYYGHLEGVRVTEGVARYTSNFSIPTTAYPTK